MQTMFLRPSPSLSPYVELYLDMRGPSSTDASADRTLRLYPSPSMSMAFGYDDGTASVQVEGEEAVPCPSLSLGGYFTRPKEYHCREGAGGTFVVVFKPWGVRRFTRFPLHEATNRNLDLHHAFSNKVREGEERLRECGSPYERRNVVEAFLRSELAGGREDRLVVDAVHTIAAERGCIHISAAAERYGLSRKQFVRRFQETVGLPPKIFSRIIRFQHTLRLFRGPIRHIEIAYESGYFDQAHFTKEFKELAGVSPGKFLSSMPRTRFGEACDEVIRMSPFYNTIYQ